MIGRAGGIRLSKFVRQTGVASRQDAEKLVRLGRIQVNGTVATFAGRLLTSDELKDVTLDGVKLSSSPPLKSESLKDERFEPLARLWLYNKSRGELCSFTSDMRSRPTIGERMRAQLVGGRRSTLPFTNPNTATDDLVPVDRLEFNTEGLCLITNSGAFARFLGSQLALKRTYRVRVNGKVTSEKLAGLARGIHLQSTDAKVTTKKSAKTLPLACSVDERAKKGSNSWLTLSSSAANNQRNLQTALGRVYIRPSRIISTEFGPFRLPVKTETGQVSIPPGGLVEAKIPPDLFAQFLRRRSLL